MQINIGSLNDPYPTVKTFTHYLLYFKYVESFFWDFPNEYLNNFKI